MDSTLKLIDLAAEADFALNGLTIRPALREIASASGCERLEPRVMQVLVALSRHRNQVVSRDQLVALCWDGRAVGEDAIQRAIAKVRRISEATRAFTIDTIPRVGYCLKSDSTLPTEPAPKPTPSDPVLAVLPFDNLSDDREMQFFSDGVSEEILHSIARAKGLAVVGRMSAFQFRGDRKSEAGKALGATHVLDGAVRRSGSRVRISAQLAETITSTTIWSDQFDRDVGDTLVVQTEIAGAIAKALRLQLDKSSTEPIDPSAYDLWLRARSLNLKDLSPRSAPAVAALLEQAVAIAPGFAAGWAALASARAMLLPGLKGAIGNHQHRAALAAANRALSLDPLSADGLQAFAYLKPPFAAYEEKLTLLGRALELAPNDAFATFGYAGALMAVGRISDALPHASASFELEPQAETPHFLALRAIALCSSGAFDEGVALIDDARQKSPDSYAIWYLCFWLNSARDNPTDSLARLDANPPPQAELHVIESALIRHFLSTALLPQPERTVRMRALLNKQGPALWIDVCKWAATTGCAEEAYDAFETAFRVGQPLAVPSAAIAGFPPALQAGGLFMFDGAALRSDARFARVCARLNLVDYWMKSGHWPDCASEVSYDFRSECEKAAHELAKVGSD